MYSKFKLALLILALPSGLIGYTAGANAAVIPPGAPTNVSAVGHNQSATVSFTAPTSNGGATIDWYLVTPYINGKAQDTKKGAASPITVTGLTNGKPYTFKVKAHNSAGYGSSSISMTSSITPAPEAPSAPTSVSAIAGNTTATISFTKGSSNGSSVTAYTVTSSPGNLKSIGTASPLTVSGLANGTSYTFTVTATNSVGTSAASTPSSSVTPATVPDAPTAVSTTAGNTVAIVSFTPPAFNGGATITSYTATSSPGNLTATGMANPLIVSGLTNGTSYTFTVTATNKIGTGATSNPSPSVTPAAIPDAPTAVTATSGNASSIVSFTAPASNGGAAITNYTVTSSPGNIIATGNASPINVTGLTNGTEYTFTVTATNSIGTSSASAASSSVTPATIPGAPTGVTATAGISSAVVSFAAPASDGGAPITSYTITSSPGNITATGTASPITISGLSIGTNYTFTATATNNTGTSAASDPSNNVTTTSVPDAPISVSAIGGNTAATISFAPGADNGAPITNYTVTSSPGNLSASGTASPITVSGLSNGISYTFTVTATNSVGIGASSAPSNSVTLATVPNAPTGVTATAGSTNAIVTFTPGAANDSAITSYTVTSSPGNLSATGIGSPITVYGLMNGVNYIFTVTATNSVGTSAASLPSNSVTPGLPLPASIINLTNWKITLPTGTGTSPTEIKQPLLSAYSIAPWFVSNPTGTGVQFRANVEGITTSGSSFPRSELREMNSDGTLAAWSSSTGHHVLTVTGSVDVVPPVRKRTVIGQIHDASNDIIEILGDSSISSGTQTAITYRFNGTTQATHLIDNYVLGTKFTFTIDVQSDVIKLSANGVLKATISQAGTGWYFKTGNYTQSNTTYDAPGAYGQTTLYSVNVSHT